MRCKLGRPDNPKGISIVSSRVSLFHRNCMVFVDSSKAPAPVVPFCVSSCVSSIHVRAGVLGNRRAPLNKHRWLQADHSDGHLAALVRDS